MTRMPLIAATVAALAFAAPARAVYVTASFSGTVTSQTNSGFAMGAPVTGQFLLDTTAGHYLDFSIGGRTYAPAVTGVVAVDAVTPDQGTALFEAQNSQVAGAPANMNFYLDLEALTKFGTTDPLFIASHLATVGLDTNPGDTPYNTTFGYNLYDASGTLTASLAADVSSIAATVPEPASLAAMVMGLLGFGVVRRRG